MSSDGHLTLPMTLGTAWSAPSPDRLGTPLRPSGILSVTTWPAHAHERPLPTLVKSGADETTVGEGSHLLRLISVHSEGDQAAQKEERLPLRGFDQR